MARVQERFRERGRRKVGRKRKRRRKLNSSVNMKLTGWKKERSASRVSLVLLPDSFPELRRKDIEENSDRTGKSRIVETARLKSVVAALYARYSFNFSNPHTCLTQKSVGARIEMVHASYLYDESGQEGRDECVRTHRKITTPSFPRDRGKYKFSRFVLFKLVRPPQTSGSNTG